MGLVNIHSCIEGGYWNLEQSINTHKEHMKPSKIAEKAIHAEESTSTED